METEDRTPATPESRELARQRLRKLTMRIGAGAVGAAGLLGAVAAFTIPGQKSAAPVAAAGPDQSTTSGFTIVTRRGDDNQIEGDGDDRYQGAQPAPAAPQLQPAQTAPQLPTGGRPRAVTGGSR